MAKTALTIAISGTYNGRALERAREDLEKMKIRAVSEMGGAGSAMVNFGAKAAEVGGEIHNLGYKLEQVGSKATAGLTVPIVAAAAAVGAAAVDMDTSLTNVRKTVDGTEQQYQQLKDSAIEFSKTNAVSASQIMDIQSLGAQLGFAIDELDEFGRVVSGLDIATNMDAETAGTELAQFANITKMAHEDISNYGSAIVGLGNNMATTESDISHMAMRLAAAGTQVGMSQADILGLAAAMSSMGIEAEAGGTAISTIMSQIDKDIATGSDAVEEWAKAAGMSAEDFADAWRKKPIDALSRLLSGMDEATEAGGNMSVMLEDLGIDSVRQTDIMKRLAGNSGLVADAVALSNDEWKKNTALTNEVSNRNASMSAKFQILQNKVTAVAEKVGTPLVNALLDVVDAAEPLIEGIADAAQAFADMDEQDQKMILGLVRATAAFGPVTSVAGKLTQGIGDLVVGVGKGAQHLGMLKNEMGLIRDATSAVVGPTLSIGEAVTTLGAEQLPAVTGALGGLQTMMAGLALGAVVITIGAIVGAIADYLEHQQKVIDATEGLTSAIDAADEAYSNYADGTERAAKSLAEVREEADDALESQAKLAKSMEEQWRDYGTNAAVVDGYAKKIRNLTQKYDDQGTKLKLTKKEQAELKAVVDGYNEATGDSVEILDAEWGVLDRSTGVILANAEAFKERARAEAALEMYKDLYKQQLTDELALQDATAELTRLKELEAQSWNNLGYNGVNPYSAQVAEAQRHVSELTDAIDSNKESQEQLIDVMAEASPKFDTFQEAVEDAGIAMEEFGELTDVQLRALENGFDGSLASIVETCREQGIEIPDALASAMSSGSDAVWQAGTGLGDSAGKGVAKGVEDSKPTVKEAAEGTAADLIATLRDSIFGGTPLARSAARGLGDSMVEGVKEGIVEKSPLAADAIADTGKGMEKSLRDTLGIFSPSRVMAELGRDTVLGLKQGIEEHGGEASDAMGTLGRLVHDAASGLPSRLGRIGDDSGASLTRGLDSHRSAAKSSGAALKSSAEQGARPAASALGTVGANAARSFANAIGRTSAYGSGQSLAVTARNGMGSVGTYSTGRNFAAGFANGMGGVNIWNAAWNVGRSALNAIKSALGIASPSKEARKVGEWFGQGAVLGMRATEDDIAAESKRMSEAMSLTPTVGAVAGEYATSYQSQGVGGGRQFTFNVTVNVTARDERQAAGIGQSLGEELYLEFVRRERAA